MIGETISHYKILEKLGEGGMGVVYKAEDTKLNRTVALKFLPPEVTRFPEARARFLHEAQAAAALNHPNICTIHDVEDVEGRVFLAMEHIEGESLADRIARGPVKIEDAVAIGVATAEGLSAAHSRGIVHRDIKPGNVMLTRDGRVKILDFGLAVAPELTRLTREGRTTGTISYMSPEQSRGGDVDHRTDIWSLGVVLYEMVTGRRPFAGEHEQAVLLSIIHDEPDAPTGLRTGVPPELERIIAKAMAKDPGDRYQHVDDMIVDLRGVARSRTAETATAATSGTRTAPSARRRRRGHATALVAAAIVVAVLAVAWVILKSPWRGSPETMPAGPDRILVAAFDNRSGDPSLDYLSDSLVTSISEGLAQMGLVEVVPQSHAAAGSGDTAERVRQPDTGRLLESAREAGASVLVVGSFHVRMDSLRIEARVLDASDGKAINVIPHEDGPLATPSVAIDRIRSRVMGSLAARADPTLGRYARSHAPSYEAYREYESGMKDFGARTPVALAHFNRAIELDAEFVDPWIFKVAALASLDRFAEADSLIQDLRSRRGTLPPHLRLYLDTFEARLRGEDEEALRNVREIVRIAPSHFMSRRFLAVIALRLNRPREAIANLERLQTEQPETDLYIESWTYGGLANAYHMLGEYQRELQILETAAEKFPDMLWLRSRQARALAALGRIEDIERLIEDTSASPAGHGSVGLILLAAADELRAHGHPEAAEDFAEQAVRWYRTNLESEGASEPSRNLLGHALYSAEQWDEAREVFGGLAREHSDNIDYAGYLGALAARAGETETADAIRESLLAIDEPYDFGMNTYWGACISAQLGRKDEAMELLRRSYAEGAGLGLHVHQDVDLEPLWDHPPFKRFIAPRG